MEASSDSYIQPLNKPDQPCVSKCVSFALGIVILLVVIYFSAPAASEKFDRRASANRMMVDVDQPGQTYQPR